MKSRFVSMLVLACLAAGALQAQNTPSPALLVLAKQDRSLAIVDPSTLKVVTRIPAGPDPHEVVSSPDGKLAFISNYGFGAYHTISVVDLVTQKPLYRINLGVLWGPHGLAFAGGELYFTAEVNKVIGRYNPSTRRIDWILGTGQNRTHMVMVSKSLNRIFTSNVNSGAISIIEKTKAPGEPPPGAPARGPGPPLGAPIPNWNETVIETGIGTEGFDVSPDGKELWAAAAQKGTVAIIDLSANKLVQTLQANLRGANRVKFTSDGKYVFVSCLRGEGGDLAVFDAHSRELIKRMHLGHGAAGILMQPGGSRAYVSCSPDNYVAVIDLKTLQVVGHIYPGRGPDGLAWAVRQ
ncbi:MAG TPA: cytochrome D1 domain-containing protein [Terriglobia bacterium]|nr:cytochrome D1 domain-containing protein [Terriglobia bacterium]